MAQQDNYQLLVEKLDQFIRKYYINQLIRGTLYSVGLVVLLFLVMSVLEYYFYFGSGTRRVLFYSFIGISSIALIQWVFLPVLSYFRLGSVISHEQAAGIIGNHFADVKDKLLNVLQLRSQADKDANKELIMASVNQKTEEIKLVPFKSAINLSQNRKYLRYALPPLLLLLVLLFAAPSMIKESAFRLVNSGREFLRPAPFEFIVEKDELSVVQFEDFLLSVKIEGEQLPNEVFINVDNVQYRLTRETPDLFTYRFSNVQKDTKFRLSASSVQSTAYTLEVLKKPNITGFEVKLDYPSYIGRKNESLNSIGDLVVPMGTRIDWIFNAENTDQIQMQFAGRAAEAAKRFANDLFTFKRQALRDEPYKLYISNQLLPKGDSITYSITVIPDLYPSIHAEKFQDSTDSKLLFFIGEAGDDYGLMSLSFNYRIKKAKGKPGELQTLKLRSPAPGTKQLRFDHIFDLNVLNLQPGDEVTYYFEVYDNDAVNGSKPARTNLMQYAMPTVEQFKAMAEKNNEQIKTDLQKALEESRRIQQEMKRLREKLLQEKELDWQTRKEMEKLLERQKELEKQIEEAKKNFEENRKNQQEFSQMDENILEKQEQLQKLFNEVMSDEMKELMKKIEEMLQKMEKDQALEMMQRFEMEDRDMEKELDRLMELFKQLELEHKMQEALKELQELAEKQEKLSEETKKTEEQPKQNEKTANEQQQKQEDLQKQQQEINEKFQDIKEQMKDIEQKNQELEKPKDIENQDQQMQDIQQDLNKSQQELKQQQNKKASESQKNAAEKMKDMANNMQMQMQQSEMQQMQEDMKSLRQLLENLVGLSFDQEDLIKDLDKVNTNTPRYVELVRQQFKLKDDFKLVEDSLQALSKRVFQIESFVTEKVSEINENMSSSLYFLEERQKPQAGNNQQRSMKNLNDLALMLSEVMNQMQQQMSAMMAGNQMCTNPGQGQQPSPGSVPQDKISEGQQQLNEQMRKMKEQMDKKGKESGGGSGKDDNGEGMSSEDFAKMAARQAALRKALRDKQKELQQRGQGSKELQDLIDKMDRVETDLVNKKLTNEMLKRQQEILTRLLEHEKAERERGFEEKRKAEMASEKERRLPPSLEEYIKKREAEIEMYKTVSPSLKPYYKSLVEEYFKTLKSE
ncbi:MAG TPA: DUF4175 domain-containing protein [Saprospiraceae bacterium]|nr:DUF4175 domain-containing protein [Saprospiraceae bacterium]HMP22511.1 DUF4175 domain-containing protein [Saprospiraceae bacterium]